MRNIRLIPRLDIKGPNLIKGIHLEGLRVMGDPQEFARRYYEQGADELLYVDVVASLYGRNSLHDIVQRATRNVFVPLTVTGGIRSVDDVRQMLRAGADKIGINTAATKRPELIREVSRKFGSQCMVLSIEAKRVAPGRWEAYTDNGREKTGLDVIEWARRGVELGAGEILLTSVDREGTREGFDIDLVAAVSKAVPVPVIASGGMGKVEDAALVVREGAADAVAMADILHYGRFTLPQTSGGRTRSRFDRESAMSRPSRSSIMAAANLLSVMRAFEHCGATPVLTDDPAVHRCRRAPGTAWRRRVCRRYGGAARRAASSSRFAVTRDRADRSLGSAWACRCWQVPAKSSASMKGWILLPDVWCWFRQSTWMATPRRFPTSAGQTSRRPALASGRTRYSKG